MKLSKKKSLDVQLKLGRDSVKEEMPEELLRALYSDDESGYQENKALALETMLSAKAAKKGKKGK